MILTAESKARKTPMAKSFLGIVSCALAAATLCGCIVIRPRSDSDVPSKVLVANPQNVYRTATNVTIRALVQDEKSGKWVEAECPVLIPAGYYVGSGL